MRYAVEEIDGVDLVSGTSPIPNGAIQPVINWDGMLPVPYHYRKVVDRQVVEMTQDEKDAWDLANPPTLEEQQEEAQTYLDDTDWYVIRKSDPSSGVDVPVDVVTARGDAREIL